MTEIKNKYARHAEKYLRWLGHADRDAFEIFAPSQRGWSEKRRKDLSWMLSTEGYKVARTILTTPEKSKGKRRFEPIFDIVDKVSSVSNRSEAIEAVEHVRIELRKFYHRDLLVAASKILWFKFKSPIIICDNLATGALNLDRNRLDYKTFYNEWYKRFTEEEPQISKACAELVKKHQGSKGDISQLWFRERVFDFYLCGF